MQNWGVRKLGLFVVGKIQVFDLVLNSVFHGEKQTRFFEMNRVFNLVPNLFFLVKTNQVILGLCWILGEID